MEPFLAFPIHGEKMMNSFRLNSDNMFERPEISNSESPAKIVFLSVEGNDTEKNYFDNIEKHRKELGIQSLVHIHVLRRSKDDNNSGVASVLELLEEYIRIRDTDNLAKILKNYFNNKYDESFITSYLNNTSNDEETKKQFENDLEIAEIDYSYAAFLNNFKGNNEDDVFGIIIDRDWHCHDAKQLIDIYNQCNSNGYNFYIVNPAFEFWLLLHLIDVKKTCTQDELNSILLNEKVSNAHTYTSKKVSNIAGHSKKISETVFKRFYLPNVNLAIQRVETDFKTKITDIIDFNHSENNNPGELGTNLSDLFKVLKE